MLGGDSDGFVFFKKKKTNVNSGSCTFGPPEGKYFVLLSSERNNHTLPTGMGISESWNEVDLMTASHSSGAFGAPVVLYDQRIRLGGCILLAI